MSYNYMEDISRMYFCCILCIIKNNRKFVSINSYDDHKGNCRKLVILESYWVFQRKHCVLLRSQYVWWCRQWGMWCEICFLFIWDTGPLGYSCFLFINDSYCFSNIASMIINLILIFYFARILVLFVSNFLMLLWYICCSLMCCLIALCSDR